MKEIGVSPTRNFRKNTCARAYRLQAQRISLSTRAKFLRSFRANLEKLKSRIVEDILLKIHLMVAQI